MGRYQGCYHAACGGTNDDESCQLPFSVPISYKLYSKRQIYLLFTITLWEDSHDFCKEDSVFTRSKNRHRKRHKEKIYDVCYSILVLGTSVYYRACCNVWRSRARKFISRHYPSCTNDWHFENPYTYEYARSNRAPAGIAVNIGFSFSALPFWKGGKTW